MNLGHLSLAATSLTLSAKVPIKAETFFYSEHGAGFRPRSVGSQSSDAVLSGPHIKREGEGRGKKRRLVLGVSASAYQATRIFNAAAG